MPLLLHIVKPNESSTCPFEGNRTPSEVWTTHEQALLTIEVGLTPTMWVAVLTTHRLSMAQNVY
jgi:hypothetical protein